MYTPNFCLVDMTKGVLNTLPDNFNVLSKKVVTNLNINPSSLIGFAKLTQLIIWNSHKYMFHQERINQLLL